MRPEEDDEHKIISPTHKTKLLPDGTYATEVSAPVEHDEGDGLSLRSKVDL